MYISNDQKAFGALLKHHLNKGDIALKAENKKSKDENSRPDIPPKPSTKKTL